MSRFSRAPLQLAALLAAACLTLPARGLAQGPAPENGATLFPGGALVSWGSAVTTRSRATGAPGTGAAEGLRPTLAHEGAVTFAWGFRRDFELIAELPIATHKFDPGLGSREGGTGLGDLRLLVKHRFLRRDSERGTTQAAFTFGPKLPSGRVNWTGAQGAPLPMGLQPGSGSTDLALGLAGTYTGLLHVKRLVADATLEHLVRTEGRGSVRLGNETEARFWLSYRPHQSRSVGREWFIGPSLTWQRTGRDRLRGSAVAASGSRTLWLGATTYASPRAGLVLWFSAEQPVSSVAGAPFDAGRRIRFGITRQFPLHF